VAKRRSGDLKNSTVVLSAKRGGPVRLPLASLNCEDLDTLVSACELWANRWTKDDSFIELVELVTNRRHDDSDSSFTALWLQEAHRRVSTTPFVPLEPGSGLQNGRVKIVQTLTAGGWSAVYLCQWLDKTPAVLKEAVVPPAAGEELKNKAFQQFEREAVLLAGLDHPQIAKVMDYFIENSRQYMVLQRISGVNLRTYIMDRGPVSERQALKWTSELAEIIAYLHGRELPIIHRDLTPENLVLDMKGSLVLIDFGSANEFVGTVTGTLVGKPSYVSPEQFSGHARTQSDLYSLGAVIYFMVTGKDPEPLAVASPKTANDVVSPELDQLVGDLMRLDVRERMKSIDDVKSRLLSVKQTG
jgi:eukaryotic-like serine/threonine-protein kinase